MDVVVIVVLLSWMVTADQLQSPPQQRTPKLYALLYAPFHHFTDCDDHNISSIQIAVKLHNKGQFCFQYQKRNSREQYVIH